MEGHMMLFKGEGVPGKHGKHGKGGYVGEVFLEFLLGNVGGILVFCFLFCFVLFFPQKSLNGFICCYSRL